MSSIVILTALLAILWIITLAIVATYANKDEAKTHIPEKRQNYIHTKPKKLTIRKKK